jgi:hypothetical protein
MTKKVDDLVRRQTAILVELRALDRTNLDLLFNTVTPDDTKARKLLRGLLMTDNITTRIALTIKDTEATEIKEGVIPALPGFFLIDLIPRPDGTFDRERIIKTPVIAWAVDRCGYVTPLIPGMPKWRWAVLMPEGFVLTDEFSALFGGLPVALKDWIKSEIDWLESPDSVDSDFLTPSEKLLIDSGPLAKAIWQMMSRDRVWGGTPEKMLSALSRFRDNATDWPSGPRALVAALTELVPRFTEAGFSVIQFDDGRLMVARPADEGVATTNSTPQRVTVQ